jgi:HEAT repeat protein
VRSLESLATIAHRAWSDEEPAVRAAAIVALGLADTEGAYTYLLESARSDDPAELVRGLARQALK